MMQRQALLFRLLGLAFIIAFVVFQSCKKDDNNNPNDPSQAVESYDRAAMLSNLANNYIIPAYAAYTTATDQLKNEVATFNANPTVASLQSLRSAWENALLTWQDVAFLEFGPATNISLRSQTNIYPTDQTLIESNIVSGSYDLQLPSNFVAKGFQALDYLLNGTGMNDQEIVDYFSIASNATNAKTYLLDVANELHTNAAYVSNEWSNYASSFINNSNSNAQGSSVSNIVNELTYHYEAFVRKGKIGIPAGVFNGFSQQPMPDHVEALYYQQSLPFAVRSMQAIYNYFNGIHYTNATDGEGLADYLNHVGATSSGDPLTATINDQINIVISYLNTLNDPLSNEVTGNTQVVLNTYQQMQILVAYFKVDMTAALGVLITYQDSDGD